MNSNADKTSNLQEHDLRMVEKKLYALRISMEGLRLNNINHDVMVEDSIQELNRLGFEDDRLLQVIKDAAAEYKAIHMAVSYFTTHPELIQNEAYSWDDHCQTIERLQGLAYPESKVGKERQSRYGTVAVHRFNEAIYRRFAQLIAEPLND